MSYHALFICFGNNYDGSNMIHGHIKVAAVPMDGFKQSTSPRGLDNRQGSDN